EVCDGSSGPQEEGIGQDYERLGTHVLQRRKGLDQFVVVMGPYEVQSHPQRLGSRLRYWYGQDCARKQGIVEDTDTREAGHNFFDQLEPFPDEFIVRRRHTSQAPARS